MLFSVWWAAGAAEAQGTAATSVEDRAIARITLAAKQRHLVQQIATASCFTLSPHNPQENAATAWLGMVEFDGSFATLIQGDPRREWAPEEDASVLAAVAGMQANWSTFRAATQQIISGDRHSVPMRQMVELSAPVLTEVNAAVDRIIAAHAKGLDAQKAHVAGFNEVDQQPMLIQRAAMAMCYISLGIDEDRMRSDLRQTINLFETALDALEKDLSGTVQADPESPVLLPKINEIRALWDQFAEPLRKVAQGAEAEAEDVAFVENATGQLTEMSNALASLSKAREQ
ncbi:MAG: type IV pili methyl-accepting chemotaxis transducer N-terminal domain-containing protein [Pseudomonadota bacterium]